MSTLKVNKIRDTAGSADSITLDPNGGAVIAGVTTASTIKVGAGVTISSDGDIFHTGVCTATAFAGQIPAASIVGVCTSGLTKTGGFGGCKIIQVKTALKTDAFTSSASTADITGLTVTMDAPASSSSKYLIVAAVNAMANNVSCTYRINGTTNGDIGMGAADGSRTRGNVGDLYEAYNSPFVTHTSIVEDAPGNTNQQTYKVVSVSAAGHTVKVNRGNTDTDGSAKIRGASSITVFEIES